MNDIPVVEAERLPARAAPERLAFSRRFVLIVRFCLLLAAAGAGMVALAIALGDGAGKVAGASYGCPMHPEVHSGKPGQCPICGMALELNAGASMRGTSDSPMPGMADLSAVENVRKHKVLDFARLRALPFELRELRGAASVEADSSINAVFYRDQASVITTDDLATFTPTQTPEIHFAVRLSSAKVTDWDRSMSRLHFELAGSTKGRTAPVPEAGQVGWVEIPRKPRSVLTVPADAILQSPDGPYVLRALGGFTFEKRPIEIAETFSKQGIAVVLSGLSPQDRVVARAAFFLDADRRLESPTAEEDWSAP
jgi:heavy metal-binding protein